MQTETVENERERRREKEEVEGQSRQRKMEVRHHIKDWEDGAKKRNCGSTVFLPLKTGQQAFA